MASGSAWRYAWLDFAAGALAVTIFNLRILPPGPRRGCDHDAEDPDVFRPGAGWFARRAAVPLYLTALSYGVVGSVCWLLAVEAVSSATGSGENTPALFWTLMGAAGTAGVSAGMVFDRLGLGRSHMVLFTTLAMAVVLLGLAPGVVVAVGVSALLYGPAFMAISALLAVWSYQVFPERPTTGFTATVFFLWIGTVIGPATLGIVADHHGRKAAFLLTATISLATVRLRPGQASL